MRGARPPGHRVAAVGRVVAPPGVVPRRRARALPLAVVVAACASGGSHGEPPDAATPLVMRRPDSLHGPGRPDAHWRGSAAATAAGLEFVFPPIEADNVGCAATDSLPGTQGDRYWWSAAAWHPDSRYPRNEFRDVRIDFSLPHGVLPTPARMDSALKAAPVTVAIVRGEPPMPVDAVRADRVVRRWRRVAVEGRTAYRLHLVVEGRAARDAFLAAQADSVSLGWCQRDRWLTSITVPLRRR